MTEIAVPGHEPATSVKPELDGSLNPLTAILFLGVLAAGLLFTAYSLYDDVTTAGTRVSTWVPFLLLGVALFVALGFEFVNGFHDTANAVATVIYTHALPPHIAVVWSGLFNFLGVLFSSGAVAFGIITLLPVELILQVGSSAGFAMVFALLIAAIVWNLGTWYFGLPASSSHTLIGSIPDPKAGIMLAKQLTFMANADAAGIVLGARVPIILTSRADSVRARMTSCAIAVMLVAARGAAPG